MVRANKIAMILLLASVAELAFARHLSADADEIDRDDLPGAEFFNDKNSYHYPIPWRWLWDDTDFGYHTSAGSLDVRRFDYLERIKLSTDQTQLASFAFTEQHTEDYVEERIVREIRLGLRPLSLLQVSILGDTGSDKEFADLGAAVSLGPDSRNKLEAYYWSIDHYYDSKKEFPVDERSRKPWTAGGRIHLTMPYLTLRVHGEIDNPMTWERESRGYTYENWRKILTTRTQLGGRTGLFASLLTSNELKFERKTWLTDSVETEVKGLQRRVDMAQAEVSYGWSQGEVATVAWQGVQRDVDFEHSYPAGTLEDDLQEPVVPDAIAHQEQALLLTWYRPLGDGHYWQWGAHINDLTIEREDVSSGDELVEELEAKLQTAWEYRFGSGARLFVNLSWDLDQLEEDYPYNDRPFKPWGGGNIQIVAAF